MASHYYAQLGIGGLARPMVIGDRLWLFNQTPNGPAPVQSVLLSSTPSMSSYYPASRPYSVNGAAPPNLMDSARSALIARGQPLNYGLNKPMIPFSAPVKSFDSYSNMRLNSRYDYPSTSGRPNILNNLRYPHHFINSDGSSIADDRLYLEKYGMTGNTDLPVSNGLAELEKAFGDRTPILAENDNDKPSAINTTKVHKIKTEQTDENSCSSEIDCEMLDE